MFQSLDYLDTDTIFILKWHTKNTQTLPKILKIRKRKQWNKSVRKKQADIRW